jgi:hypothetical protein
LSQLFYNAKELQKPRPAPYEYRTYKAEPLVLIVAPTRELCSQIFDECRKVKKSCQIEVFFFYAFFFSSLTDLVFVLVQFMVVLILLVKFVKLKEVVMF